MMGAGMMGVCNGAQASFGIRRAALNDLLSHPAHHHPPPPFFSVFSFLPARVAACTSRGGVAEFTQLKSAQYPYFDRSSSFIPRCVCSCLVNIFACVSATAGDWLALYLSYSVS